MSIEIWTCLDDHREAKTKVLASTNNIDFVKRYRDITVVYWTVASNGTCDSVRPVIANLEFVFQVGHLFILLFLLAETRLDS